MRDWLLWISAAVLGLASLATLYFSLFHDRPRGRRRCPRCWYDMAGVPGLTCPECGKAPRRERALHRTRRRWRYVPIPIVLAALAFGLGRAPFIIRHGGWWALAPTCILAATSSFSDPIAEQALNRASPPDDLYHWERAMVARACARLICRSPAPPAPPRPTPIGTAVLTPVPDSADADPPARQPTPDEMLIIEDTSAVSSRTVRSLRAGSSRSFTIALSLPYDPVNHAPNVLRELGPDSRAALIILISGLRSPHASVRTAAAQMLGTLRFATDPVVTALGAAVSDADTDVRRAAIYALGALAPDNPRVAMLVAPALEDPDPGTRTIASAWFRREGFHDPAAIPLLHRGASDSNRDVQLNCIDALADMGPAAVDELPFFIGLFDSQASRDVRTGAVVAIGLTGAARPAAIETLIRALADPESHIKCLAAEALARFGSAAAPARDPLRRLLSDKELLVSLTARDALRAIDEAPDIRHQ